MTTAHALSALNCIRGLGLDVTGIDWAFTAVDGLPGANLELELFVSLVNVRHEATTLSVTMLDDVSVYLGTLDVSLDLDHAQAIAHLRLTPDQHKYLRAALGALHGAVYDEAREALSQAWESAVYSVCRSLRVDHAPPQAWPPPPAPVRSSRYHQRVTLPRR